MNMTLSLNKHEISFSYDNGTANFVCGNWGMIVSTRLAEVVPAFPVLAYGVNIPFKATWDSGRWQETVYRIGRGGIGISRINPHYN